MAVNPVITLPGLGAGSVVGGIAPRQGPADGADFKKFLLDNLNTVNQMQQESQQAQQAMMLGEEQDITKVMVAVEKADKAFQTLMAVRNKIMESYESIMQMRV